MRIKLTPAFVNNAPVPARDRKIFWDTTIPGFGLQVTAKGHRSYVVQYRAGRRSRRLSLNGVLTLAAARREARGLLGIVARGGDPLGDRRKAAAAASNTLRSVCDQYFAREGAKLRRAKERQHALERLVFPTLGHWQINDLRRSDLNKLLDRIEDENGPVMADNILAFLRRIFNWLASRSDDFRSPIVRGMARSNPSQRARQRILTDDEIRAVWWATDAKPGPYGPFIKFLLLTAVRRDEAAQMRRTELSGDVWTIPAARYKTAREHFIPLSKAALAILNGLPHIGEVVFSFDGKHFFGGHTQRKKRLDQVSGVTGWVLHDLRRTARSLMSRAGVNADIAERCLGHKLPGVRGIYDRHSYVAEMRHAFEVLAATIERIITPPRDNVVPIAGA